MKDRQFGVITFKSTHHAIKGESVFKGEDIEFRIIPTPREVTHSCGLAIKFDLDDIDMTKDIVDKNHLNIDGIFKVVKSNSGNKVERLN